MIDNKFWFRFKIALSYVLVKFKFLQSLFPKRLIDKLPLGWNDPMFWLAFKSGGQKIHYDYYCRLRQPDSYRPKVMVDEQYRLTEADIRSFYENGYIGPFTLVSPAEAESVKTHLLQLVKKPESPIYPYSQGAFEIQTQAKSQSTKSNHDVASRAMDMMKLRDRYLDDPVLLSLFEHPAVTERCAQLLGSDLLLWRTQFFPKPPKSAGTPFHQASTYLFDNRQESVLNPPNLEELFQLTCWIALTDANEANGCMTIIPGTGRDYYPMKVELYDPSKSDTKVKGKGQFGNITVEMDYPVDWEKVKTVPMQAGQFYLFSERFIHGSLGNTTDQWRWGVNGRIVRPDTRIYTKKMLAEGHSYDVARIKKIKLDNWKAALIRGEDRFGYNSLLEKSATTTGETIGVN